MLEKLQAIARRLDQVERQLSDPAIYADREMLTRLSREQKELTPIAAAFRAWQQAEDDCAQAQELLTDPEMRELAQEELHRARQERDRLSEELKRLLLPRDPNDDRNVILEVRAGIGGEEGALFAADLLRMYALYAERRGWNMEHHGAGRRQGGQRHHRGTGGLVPPEIRGRDPPGPAGAGNRVLRPHPDLRRHRGRDA